MVARRSAWWEKVVYVLGWPLSAALVLVDGFALRGVLLQVLARLGEHQTGVAAFRFGGLTRFADRSFVLVIACATAGLAIYFEHYYRKGLEEGRLLSRLARVLAVGLTALLAGVAIQILV